MHSNTPQPSHIALCDSPQKVVQEEPAHLSGEPKLILFIEDGRCFRVDLFADLQQFQQRNTAEGVVIHGAFTSRVHVLPEERVLELRTRWQGEGQNSNDRSAGRA